MALSEEAAATRDDEGAEEIAEAADANASEDSEP
jgi:hypothetical protein